jgi:hypothetical protein
MLGTWKITWDRGRENEIIYLAKVDKIMLRQFFVFVSDDGTLTFIDDEGCHHLGTLNEDGNSANGTYTLCDKDPSWTGKWEAVKVSD